MKKQVTFAENQMVHRYSGMNESKMVTAAVNFKNGLKIYRQPAARCEPQLQHTTTIPIPKTMTTAPFLTHTALTPAQKEYLYTVAASYSTTHVRDLITQHYMNVLHRCIRAGNNPERDNNLVATSAANDASAKHQSDVPSRVKHKGKLNTGARNPGKSLLPKIPSRQARSQNRAGGRGGGGGGGGGGRREWSG
ncbi:family with sequence similarity 216 member A [Thunnus maccoyii]|uniref:family with sequence similarity 216 member A n=1 Tax=Thunnus maccoyii TaxID=8240 RepID=UPI001C4CAA86|nr:family with sequence similarity 216 member A [Thunnus maccoyii]